MREEQDQYSRALYELCSMIIHVFQSPPLPRSLRTMVVGRDMVGPSSSSASSSSRPLNLLRQQQMSPAAFTALFLGVSVSLMLFGSVTFVIGLLLMPLVVALVMLFYFAGMVSNLSEFSRSILWGSSASSNDRFSQEWDH
ncbi:hypothetical protein Leryth_009306 [Lithospermum erythrorhizon]|nr:hypothetical protein Leryth_009306 [Lithospermum erythrorhizon]